MPETTVGPGSTSSTPSKGPTKGNTNGPTAGHTLLGGAGSKEKVVLCFSGGLDTSFCVVYLIDQGYDVVTVTVDTGGFSQDELASIEKKAMDLGSASHTTIDATAGIWDTIISYLVKLNGLYEGAYPLMCADRYIIAEAVLKVASEIGAGAVSHGCTAIGNDQVRFDAAFATLAPEMKVITPVRDLCITRDEEIAYLAGKGMDVDAPAKKYSINENIFGVTVSGSEIDLDLPPSPEAYKLTVPMMSLPVASPTHVDITFEKGVPTSIGGEPMAGTDLLKVLNSLGGSYGYGSHIYTGDCVVGIKGRILFESPGLFMLVKAHTALEQYTLTKGQLAFSKQASAIWSDHVYNGLYYEPLVKDIESMSDSLQKNVSGTVTVELVPNAAKVVAVSSPNKLMDDKVATYAQKATWTGDEVKGFITFHAMQQKMAW